MATLTGRPLRYFLTLVLLAERRVLTVGELEHELSRAGIQILGRPGKTISDALRWEVKRGRVVRVGPGNYRVGSIPESTQRYMRSLLADWIDVAAATGHVVGAGRSQEVEGLSVTVTIPFEDRPRRPLARAWELPRRVRASGPTSPPPRGS